MRKRISGFITSNCSQNRGLTTAFHNAMNDHQWRLNPLRYSTPSSSNLSNNRMFSSVALRYRRSKGADNSKRAFLLHTFGKRFYSSSAGKPVKTGQLEKALFSSSSSSSSSSYWAWLKKHKVLGFAMFSAFSFLSLQWVPVSERMHMAISTDKIENMIGALVWEQEARENQGRILSPDSPESIRVTRILRDILQATHQTLGLKNDLQVSAYVPRKELQMKEPGPDQDSSLSKTLDFLKFQKEVIKYYSSHPNKRVQNEPQTVEKKFGIKYGTKHLEGLNWEVMVIEKSVENAVHVPNGRIMFYTEWFENPDFKDEDLAVILAHEVGHGLARHSSETLLRLIWSLVLSVLVQIFFDDSVILRKAKNLINDTVFPFISRRREVEADRIGMMLMAAAGYDPRRAPEFYEKYCNHDDGEDFMKATHHSGKKRAEALRNDEMMEKAKNLYDQVCARR